MKASPGKMGMKEKVVVVFIKKQIFMEMRACEFNGKGNFSVLFLFLLFISILFLL